MKTKNVDLILNILTGSLIIICSIFFLNEVKNVLCFFLGIFVGIKNIMPCILMFNAYKMSKSNEFLIFFIINLLLIVFGFMFAFGSNNIFVTITFSIILILVPIIGIVKKENIKENILQMLLGVVLMFNFLDNIFKIALIIFGVIIILTALINYFKKDKIEIIIEKNQTIEENDEIIDAEIIE